MDAETKADDALASRPKISFVGVQKRYPGKGKNEGTLALDSFNFAAFKEACKAAGVKGSTDGLKAV